MHNWDVKEVKIMDGWISMLEEYNIFFSYPLDLDFMMLSYLELEYEATATEGPQVPDKELDPVGFGEKLKNGIQATLKSSNATAETYSEDEKELMIWYNYLFLGRGKPSTHIEALSEISDEDLAENIPEVLERIFDRIMEILAKN